MPTDEPLVVTSQDVRNLNRASVARAATFARLSGAVIICIGILILFAWAWIVVRAQIHMNQGVFYFGFDEESGDAGLAERIDAFVNFTAILGEATVAIGLGVGLRLIADYTQTRVGGTVTGFVEGDVFGDDPDA